MLADHHWNFLVLFLHEIFCKMILGSQKLHLVKDQSMAADFETNAMEIGGFDCGSMVISWTGADAFNGIFIPQFSNDGECWCDYLAESDAQRAASVNGCRMYEFSTFCFEQVRLKFLHKTVSSGTFEVLVYAKRFWGRNS